MSHFIGGVSVIRQKIVESEVEEPEEVGRRGRLAPGARLASAALRRLHVLLIAEHLERGAGRGRRRMVRRRDCHSRSDAARVARQAHRPALAGNQSLLRALFRRT